jgi:hypothetical protein
VVVVGKRRESDVETLSREGKEEVERREVKGGGGGRGMVGWWDGWKKRRMIKEESASALSSPSMVHKATHCARQY